MSFLDKVKTYYKNKPITDQEKIDIFNIIVSCETEVRLGGDWFDTQANLLNMILELRGDKLD